MSHLTIIHSIVLVFRRDETPAKPAKKDRNRCIFTDIYANPYSSGEALQFSPGGRGLGRGGTLQNAKDFLKRFARIPPIFICKSSLTEIKEFHLDLCQAMQASSCEMQIFFFCIGALPTTNDSWSNQESLDPLSYRCVCIG